MKDVRTPTFLARLHRRTKLAFVGIIAVLFATPWIIPLASTSINLGTSFVQHINEKLSKSQDRLSKSQSPDLAKTSDDHTSKPAEKTPLVQESGSKDKKPAQSSGNASTQQAAINSTSSAVSAKEPNDVSTLVSSEEPAQQKSRPQALPPVSDKTDLIDKTPYGDLPVISPTGRLPWQVYARPFAANEKRPRLAIVIVGLGAMQETTQTAIKELPPEVTLSFSANSKNVADSLRIARTYGHETLLDIPMEPKGYPSNDPGGDTLLLGMTDEELLSRLLKAMGKGKGFVGVTTSTGSQFMTDIQTTSLVLDNINKRGLLFLDIGIAHNRVSKFIQKSRTTNMRANIDIDAEQLDGQSIDMQFKKTEEIATSQGTAVIVVRPLPAVLSYMKKWFPELEKRGIALAPLTSIISQ